MNIDLSIKIHERNRGFFYHKVPSGIHSKKAKSQALKDITKYLQLEGEKVYVMKEKVKSRTYYQRTDWDLYWDNKSKYGWEKGKQR